MGRLRVLMWAPDWDNRWLPYFRNELGSKYDLTVESSVNKERLEEVSKDKDLYLSMWGDGVTNLWAAKFPGVPIISYLRRYELFYPYLMQNVRWDKIDALIFVNDCIRQAFEGMSKRQPKRKYTIYNAIDLDEFPLVKSAATKTKKIAFVCKVSYIKNFPLAIQVLSYLPNDYTLHHIGRRDERAMLELWFYATAMGVTNRIMFYPKIAAKDMQEWYRDKDFILSTSINEGNPNNVLEGMALGLKPVVHAWPGADTQFPPDAIFRTAEQAAQIIREEAYQPLQYRKWVEDHYSLDNIRQIHKVIEDVCGSD